MIKHQLFRNHQASVLAKPAVLLLFLLALSATEPSSAQAPVDQAAARLSGADLQSIRGAASQVLMTRRAERAEIATSVQPVREALEALRESLVELASPTATVRLPKAAALQGQSPQAAAGPAAARNLSAPAGASADDAWSTRQQARISRTREQAERLEALLAPTVLPTGAALSRAMATTGGADATASTTPAAHIPAPTLERLRGLPTEIEAALALPAAERQQRLMGLSEALDLQPPIRAVPERNAASPSLSARTKHRRSGN